MKISLIFLSIFLVLVNGDSNVCQTRGCWNAAKMLLEYMDPFKDPCQNFYQFICGNFNKRNKIGDDESQISVISLLGKDLELKLKALLQSTSIRSDEPKIFKTMRNYYWSCTDINKIDSTGDSLLLSIIQKFGGWPILERTKWPDQKFDWIDLLINFRRAGFPHEYLLTVEIRPDIRNNSRYILYLGEGSLALPDKEFFKQGLSNPIVSAYFRLMIDLINILATDDPDWIQSQLLNMLQFEISLAELHREKEEKNEISSMYNKMKVIDLKRMAPSIDWKRLIDNLVGFPVDLNQDIIVLSPKYIPAFELLIKKTEKRVIADYLNWRLILASMNGLPTKWHRRYANFSSVFTGKKSEAPRWKDCVKSISNGPFSIALSSLYVSQNFDLQSRNAAMEMTRFVRNEFINMLENDVPWMDNQTRNSALDKARATLPFIGFPEELRDFRIIDDYYKDMKINGNEDYIIQMAQAHRWMMDMEFGKLNQPNHRGDWQHHAKSAVVNAFYNMLANSIDFPAGILQGAFFDIDRPSYLNFGGIGSVIGHEITHGFDNTGRQFDLNGNNIDWWNAKTDKNFRDRAQCIRDQYGQLEIPDTGGMRINGNLTLGENIADNGGIKQAFRAFQTYAKKIGQEPGLPGLENMSQEQLFWLANGHIWCSSFRPEIRMFNAKTDPHSPPEFRVNSMAANSIHFSRAFRCSPGTPMNPGKKCEVW